MKGVVFTEFLEMVESAHGILVVDSLTSISSLHDQGAYTSAGNYPHTDMLAMVGKLSQLINVPVDDLVITFGRYLFNSFHTHYKGFFEGVDNSLQFLEGIETVIHTEVRKLYPEASLPEFECFSDESGLTMIYNSDKPFADLAEGLIIGCIDHFSENLVVSRSPGSTNDACSAVFRISKGAADND
jgi:hypothetical protein